MDRLLTEMSSTFNKNLPEPPQINLNEDNTLKWRGLHNNSYASNKRRTRKSAKIEEGMSEDPNNTEGSTSHEENGSQPAGTAAMAPPPPTTTTPDGPSSKPPVKSERVLRRTRTSSEVATAAGGNSSSSSDALPSPVIASKRAVVQATHANGAHKPTAINVVVIPTKSNKDKESQQHHTTTTTITTPTKDNAEELLESPAQKLAGDNTNNGGEEKSKTNAEEKSKATAIAVDDNNYEPTAIDTIDSVSLNGGEGSSATNNTRQKRVTRRRASTGNKEEVVSPLKRKAEEDNGGTGESSKVTGGGGGQEDQSQGSSSNQSSVSPSGEEKKPRLLMKIRTDNKSITIVKPVEIGQKSTQVEVTTDPDKIQVDADNKQEEISPDATDKNTEAPTPTASSTEPKRRGRKPGASVKNKFTEKVKILPKRTGVRGQLSPEQSPPVSQQRPSRRIKPTPKILENEELRHGFEQQNSARLLGLNASEYDAKKAALSKAGQQQVEQISVDNIYSTSNKPCPEPEDFLNELKNDKNSNGQNTPPTEEEKLTRKEQKLKERHLHQLGLRKTSRSDTNSEPSEDVPEFDRNVPFRAPQTNNAKVNGRTPNQRQRKTQLPTPASQSLLMSDELQVRRKVTTNVAVAAREKCICLCTQMSEFYSHNKTAKSLYCSAVDQIRAEKVGCCNDIAGNQLNLQRPSARVSFMVLCQSHKNRFHSHHCCPVCGVFCTEGQFMLCPRNHLFHKECVLRNGTGRVGRQQQEMVVKCPHCGVDVAEPEVNLYMECSNELTYYPNQEGFIKTARISLTNGVVATLPHRISSQSTAGTATNGQLEFNIDNLIPESVQNVRDRYRQRGSKVGVGGQLNRSGSDSSEFTSHEFFFAVNNDDIEKVAEIIASGFDVSAPYKEFHHGTCLHLIAHFGSLNMMYLILSRVASVDFINAQDKELRTAAMCAVVGQKHEILRLLVQCGADVAKRGPDGMTVLHLAAKVGNLTATEIILEHYRLKVTFQKFEAFINAVDDGQWTALVWAAENGLSSIESYLIALGASPNICDSENNSALHWAALSNSVDTILPLLGSNCDFNLQNVNGDTALHIACRHGNAHMCLIFIAHGADLQIRNLTDEMPLDCVPETSGTCEKLLKYNISLKAITGPKNNRIVLSNDLSMGREAYPVKLIGTDEKMSLPNFKYITRAIIIQNNIQIDRRISQMRICACPDNCTTDACQCSEISSQNWYDGNGRLSNEFNFDDPPMIFECNDVCGCHKLLCKNRVVQHGSKVALQVERCARKSKGWSARSISEIPKGAFVSEYTGEILTNAEADQRMDDSYFFDLGGSEHCIDANMYGNVSRFFNHSCSPNVVPIRVYFDHQDLRFPKIAFFASENIEANQEITFDYGDKFWMVKHKYFTCQCEANNCRYSAKTIAKTVEEINQRSQPITIIT